MNEKNTLSEESKKILASQTEKITGTDKLDHNLEVMLHMEITNVQP